MNEQQSLILWCLALDRAHLAYNDPDDVLPQVLMIVGEEPHLLLTEDVIFLRDAGYIIPFFDRPNTMLPRRWYISDAGRAAIHYA